MVSCTKILLAGNRAWAFLATGDAIGPLITIQNKKIEHWQKSLQHTDKLCLETPEILSVSVKTFIYGKCWFSDFWGLMKRISYLSLPLCTDN